jgi:RNA polymerase sigma-70 factor, ECF subfamily
MTADDEDLIRRAQSGDRAAFGQLVEAHYTAMFRFACKYCGNRPDAEDVTQQAFIKLAQSFGQFRHESAFTTWLYRLVLNCARDWYKRQRTSNCEDAPEESTPGNAEHAVMLDQVLALVEQMGAGFRETLALVVGEGLTHAEAALILAVKESTVSWRVHEIRKRLNAEIQPGVSV